MIPVKELSIIRISATGQTSPYVPFGTAVLLIQDGTVQVGRLMQDAEDTDSVYIDHPQNQAELDVRATQLIRVQKGEYLKSEVALTLLCPEALSMDMV